ncbi:hypothetical protein V2E39_05845 [Chryseobacterium arthrosphaerae]|uniref:DUF4293 family protein n=1 Tax=Chryseobacterium arthrosphaerae TaxID=651561 RepID=A0A1B8ZNX5_9FLAO|nr:hypothetical protein [Chryseobacterium arthrosphaerae]OCA73312.1 hypothetical protein BBI00_02675 [Chryseobacterium arthrosphaerae]
MKNTIFKYRIIGIVILVFQLLLFLFFGFGTYRSFSEISTERIFSTENFIFLFTLTVFISAFLSLTAFYKRRKVILYLNINYILVLSFFIFEYIKFMIETSFEEVDVLILFLIFSITSAFLLMTNIFKNKKVQFLELEDIGKHKD